MPKVQLPGGHKLHYQIAGDGPDVVMIHGLTGNLAVWHLHIVPALWDHFRILTYDLRGHGYSEITPAGYTADDMAGDLVELLDVLDIRQPYLVGHSYGADIALYAAHRCPERVRQVIAIEPALPALIRLRSRDDWEGWDYWVKVLEESGLTVPKERRSDMNYLLRLSLEVPKRWGPLNGLPRNARPFLRLLETTTVSQDYDTVGTLTLESIERIQTPVLLIDNETSAFLGTYHYLLAHLPHATGVLLPRTELGHFGPLEQPELVAQQILTALKPEVTLANANGKAGSE